MAIFLAGKAVCYRILAFFCYGKLHFKCESADLFAISTLLRLHVERHIDFLPLRAFVVERGSD